jgi:hypothetical protein
MPESGMGFQVLRHRADYWVVFNATVVILLSELRGSNADEPFAEIFAAEDIAAEEEAGAIQTRRPLTLQGPLSLVFSQLDLSIREPAVGLVVPDRVSGPSPGLLSSNRPLAYYRFLASPRDRRVNRKGDFAPGTYATTFADSHFVPSGFAAVGRYALPNPASARFLFQITTYDKPSFMGTATPNFGQAGGGVEVFFKSGAKNAPGASYMIDAG